MDALVKAATQHCVKIKLGSRWTHYAARWRGPNALKQPLRKVLHHFAASMCGGLNMCFALQPITISLRPCHHNPMHRYWLQGIDLLLLPLGLL